MVPTVYLVFSIAKVLLECVTIPTQNKLDRFVCVVETATIFCSRATIDKLHLSQIPWLFPKFSKMVLVSDNVPSFCHDFDNWYHHHHQFELLGMAI
jgi:hypothetical protein